MGCLIEGLPERYNLRTPRQLRPADTNQHITEVKASAEARDSLSGLAYFLWLELYPGVYSSSTFPVVTTQEMIETQAIWKWQLLQLPRPRPRPRPRPAQPLAPYPRQAQPLVPRLRQAQSPHPHPRQSPQPPPQRLNQRLLPPGTRLPLIRCWRHMRLLKRRANTFEQ